MNLKDMNRKANITCDICGKEFLLTKEVMSEETLTLEKYGKDSHEVKATFLRCPHCGKRYPVIVDDEHTLPLLEKLRHIMAKQIKQTKMGFPVSPGLEKKRRETNRKLDFKRQKLANEYNGSFYQSEDGSLEQLEYCYHVH